jgi:hypothetical protein
LRLSEQAFDQLIRIVTKRKPAAKVVAKSLTSSLKIGRDSGGLGNWREHPFPNSLGSSAKLGRATCMANP